MLDADIQSFYDAMAHSWIIRFLEQPIRSGYSREPRWPVCARARTEPLTDHPI